MDIAVLGSTSARTSAAWQWARRGTRPRQPADQRYGNVVGLNASGAVVMRRKIRRETQRRRGRPRCSAPRPGRMAHDGQARRALQHHADLPAFPRSGAEPGREYLAVSAPELAPKHRLRKLRRDRRRRMRGVAKAHRSTRNDHLHRNARLGSRRSTAMTLGMISLPTRGGGSRPSTSATDRSRAARLSAASSARASPEVRHPLDRII